MKTSSTCIYRSTLNSLLQDTSGPVEQLFRNFGVLFFSLVAKYVQENYSSCIVEFYPGAHIKLLLEQGRVLEAFKKNGTNYFQFHNKNPEGAYCIQYSGGMQWIRQTNEVFPTEPAGTIFFDQLAEAKAFFDHLDINAILLQQGHPARELYSKIRKEKGVVALNGRH